MDDGALQPTTPRTDRPTLLTVAAAARQLRIGRTLAYRQAAEFEAGNPEGLPVVRLAGQLRVPLFALEERLTHGRVVTDLYAWITAELDATAPTLAPMQPRQLSPRRRRAVPAAQLSLFDGV